MLVLPAVITSREARDTQRMLAQALQQQAKASGQGEVAVDAAALVRFDSSALAVLLECHRLARAWGRPFAVRHAPPQLLALAKLYGVDVLLMPAPAAATPAA